VSGGAPSEAQRLAVQYHAEALRLRREGEWLSAAAGERFDEAARFDALADSYRVIVEARRAELARLDAEDL
jgi:hypothetical protein